MKTQSTLDRLYLCYLSDNEGGLKPLLEACRRQAVAILKDEDASQAFMIRLWQLLEHADIRPQQINFQGWLRIRIRRFGVDWWRGRPREEQAPSIEGHDQDEDKDQEEVFAILALSDHSNTRDPYESNPENLLQSIGDPWVREVADRLLDGNSLTQIALELGVTRNAMYQRLWRWRRKNQMPVAA